MGGLSAWYRNWGATGEEVRATMRGDTHVALPSYQTTLGVTINAAEVDIWPWLMQMGYRRGGLYSYDWLDRLFGYLDGPSAERILAEWQHLAVGDEIPIGRGGGFPVKAIEPLRSLVLAGEAPGFSWSWELALVPMGDGRTRLLSRNRARAPRTIQSALFMTVLSPAAFVMTRKMLLGIKRRSEADTILNRFMPTCDVAERHQIDVAAPVGVTFAALMDTDLRDSRVVRTIFRARELMLGAEQRPSSRTRGLVAVTKEMGWAVLAEVPDREIVMGAVTQPWLANVVFRGIPPEEFARFDEAGYVKIIWMLRSDPISPRESIASTETRVVATDADARRKFRWYWARFSAGIILIRAISLRLVKKDAERRATTQRGSGSSIEMVVPPSGGRSI